MKLLLKWHCTDDQLEFDIINQDLAIWFVEKSNTVGTNQYHCGDQVVDILRSKTSTDILISEEKNYIHIVNQALQKLKMPLFVEPNDYYDQMQLNKLHKDWARTREQWPKLTELFYKLDRELFEAYQEMNCHIHFIEKSFEYRFRDPSNWRIPNPFKDRAYDWEECHLFIDYPGHGRQAFEKFQCLDEGSDLYLDDNNWDNIDAFVGIKLGRPYKVTPPMEFLHWCEQHGLVPHEYKLPLANLTDWKQNLTRARQVFTKNVTIKDNYFTLEIIQ